MTLAFAHTVALTCGCAVYVPKAALSSAPPGCSCPAGVWRRTACWQQPSCVHARVARARLWVCTHACVPGRLSVCPYACLQGMSARVYARGRVACRCCQHVFTRKHVVVRACMIVRADLCVPAQLPGGRIRRRSHGGNRKLALRLRRAGHSLPLSSREPPSHPVAGSVACLPSTVLVRCRLPLRGRAAPAAGMHARCPPLLSFWRRHPGGLGMGFPPSHDSRVPLPASRATCVCNACESAWARSASSASALSPAHPAARRTVRARASAAAALVCVRHASKTAGNEGADGVKLDARVRRPRGYADGKRPGSE